MGIRHRTIITCDGVGCDLSWEGDDNDPGCPGIDKIRFSINGSDFWTGYLCAPCEGKMRKSLKEQFGSRDSSLMPAEQK